MKRVLTLILTMALLLNIAAAALVSTAASGAPALKKVESLKITTCSKANRLQLSWKAQPQADGYQVYRSMSAKKGSFKRIATVSDNTSFLDTGLKNATTYYYKVRAFAKQNGDFVYGAFAKADLSTRITNQFAVKRYNQVYKIIQNQGVISKKITYLDKPPIEKRVFKTTENGMRYEDRYYYFPVKIEGIQTKKQLKKELMQSFSKRLATVMVKEGCVEKNGTLYLQSFDGGDFGETDFSKTKAKLTKISDKKIEMTIYRVHTYYGNMPDETYQETQVLVYERGKWVFDTHDYWVIGGVYL